MKDTLKFLAKNIVPLAGGVLLFFFGTRTKPPGREKRILIMFGGGIGDVVKRSLICEYVKDYLAGYEVTYLMPYDLTLPHATSTIHFHYKKVKVSPWAYFSLANRLRKIGFSRVVVLLPAWEGFYASLGAAVAPDVLYRYAEVEPRETVGAVSSFIKRFRARRLNVHDVDLISFYDPRWKEKYYPSDSYRMAYFFSEVVCDMEPARRRDRDEKGLLRAPDLRTEIVLSASTARFGDLGAYAAVGLGSSYAGKNWPPEKFGAVAAFLASKNLNIVLVGAEESIPLIPAFKKTYTGPFIDLVNNRTNLQELCAVLNGAAIVVGNDTSVIHIGVACRRPTVCVCYGKQIGADSCYGYEGMNDWIFGDDFKGIDPRTVIEKIEKVFSFTHSPEKMRHIKFAPSFFDNDYPSLL